MNPPAPAPQGVVQPLSDFRRRLAFTLVLASALGASLVFSVLPPILPALAKHFGGGQAGELSAQFGLTMPSLGWLIGGAVSGWVLARIGMRAMIVVAILALGAAGAAGGLTSDVASFAATRFVLGFAGAFMITGAITLLADIYDDKTRPKMIGYQKATSSFVAIPIALGVGVLAGAFGWRAPFALYAAFGVLGALFAFFAVPSMQARPRPSGQAAATGKGALRRLWPILVLIFFLHIMPIMGVTLLPFILAQHGFGSPTTVSVVICISALLMSVGAILSGYLQIRFGPWKVLCAGVLLAAGGYVVLGLAPNGYVVAAANGLAIFGCGLYFTQYLTLPLARVEPAGRATAIGLSQAAMYLGAFLNPFLLAPVRAEFGLGGTYVVVGVLAAAAVAGGVSIALARRAARPRAAGASVASTS